MTKVGSKSARRKPLLPDELATEWTRSPRVAVARVLLDGDQPPPWELISSAASPDDLERARELLEVVIDACESGDREALDRLEAAREVLIGRAGPDGALKARFVKAVDAWAREVERGFESWDLIRDALAFYAPGFRTVAPGLVRDLLRSVRRGAGGRGHVGALHVAAVLAVEANAWGLRRRGGELDADAHARAKGALKDARKAAK